jgi:hypothetical protein
VTSLFVFIGYGVNITIKFDTQKYLVKKNASSWLAVSALVINISLLEQLQQTAWSLAK